MEIRSIKELKNLAGKRVLVRADFNVPLKGKKIEDDFKIYKSLATIKFLLKAGAKIILVSHLGRPGGGEKKLSLKPIAAHLQKLLNKNIKYYNIKILNINYFDNVKENIKNLKNGEVALLDNIRFFAGEEKNDRTLAKKLAGLADIFVLDGFAVAHRDSASVTGVAKYLPAYAGLLFAQEIEILSGILEKPKHPMVVILGGAKVETKIPVLKNLLSKADHILIGGGIFNTYLFAKGYNVGKSLIGKEYKKEILKYCSNKKIVLPVDFVVGKENGKEARVIEMKGEGGKEKWGGVIKKDEAIYDVGPRTVQLYSKYIKKAQTLIWNGAVGMFETHPYEYGSFSLAHLFAARSKSKAFGVGGGGETVEILKKLKLMQDVDLVSTGGGAMLEYLGGKKLPGLKAFEKKFGGFKILNFINLFIN